MEKKISESLARKWSSGLVARTEIGRFTGGVLTSKYLANLDSQGKGPPRIRIGRKIAYPLDELIDWIEKRTDCQEPCEP